MTLRSFVVRPVLASCALVLASCAQVPQQGTDATDAVSASESAAPAQSVQVQPAAPAAPAAPASASGTAAAATETPDVPDASEPRLLRGDDHVIAAPKVPPLPKGAASSYRFEDAPIVDVIHVFMREVLKTDYVLHQPLTGTVTLATRGPVSPDDALALLEGALQANGLAMARDARGVYHIGKPEALRDVAANLRLADGKTLPPGYGAVVIPLRYIGAQEMATILRPMAPADAIVRVDSLRNLLVMTGTRNQAEGWLEVVRTFDVDLLKGMSVGLFPLKHATIKEVEAALSLVSGTPAAASAASAASAGRRATAAAPAAAAATGAGADAASGAQAPAMLGAANPVFGALRVMPVERLNSILVVTPRAEYLDIARRWIEKLDQPGDNSTEPQLNIYRVQNGDAGHLATVLSGIFGGSAPAGTAQSAVAPGLGSTSGTTTGQRGFGNTSQTFGTGTGGTSTGFGGGFGSSTALTAQNRLNTNTQAAQPAVAQLGSVRVMADDANNSILVWASRAEFEKIETALKRLDVPPTQVLIEASIIEVTLGDDLKYGLQWAFNDSARHGLLGSGVVGQLPKAATGGFSYTLTNSLGTVRATLNALAAKSLIKVISSPSIMVLDNQVATMSVGTQQPIRTGETTNLNTVGNQTTTTYQYKDTGVQLQVQPSVNSGDLVTMNISQSVTDVGDEDLVTGQRAFLQRQINSRVAVRSGQAIVLGGLIKDNTSTGNAGVPLLSSIPVVGALFGATTNSSARTELLVVITPRVVRTDPEIREVGRELRERLHALEEFENAHSRSAPVLEGKPQP
jgi:general secretion pathway protein D